MKNGDITKEELLNEMMELRQRNAELEKSELQCRQVENKLRDSEKLYRHYMRKIRRYILL